MKYILFPGKKNVILLIFYLLVYVNKMAYENLPYTQMDDIDSIIRIFFPEWEQKIILSQHTDCKSSNSPEFKCIVKTCQMYIKRKTGHDIYYTNISELLVKKCQVTC